MTSTAFTPPETSSSFRFAWRILRGRPSVWLRALVAWMLFFCLPLAFGLLLRGAIDHLIAGDGRSVAVFVAALGVTEVTPWLILLPAIYQWHGAWVFWHTVPRVNILSSLVGDPGPVTGRLPDSSGEAISRLRDDARDIAQVLDVWLDLVAAITACSIGLAILFSVSIIGAVAVTIPVGLVLAIGHVLASRLRAWRLQEREATAEVVGFIGDAFGAIAAVKVAAGELAIVRRFEALGSLRAVAARRDQVGTQVTQTFGGITGNLGLGLALLALAPALHRGDLSAGDIALFMAYAPLVASLPRVTARWAAWQRQADVSAARLGRLMADRDPDMASAPVATHLRVGPPPFTSVPVTDPAGRHTDHRLDHLAVRGLRVHLDGEDRLAALDLDVHRGELVVITGGVGTGKSLLVRALLGLIPTADGELTWNGRRIDEPSTFLVPPRVAYVPQVPRLFSESLADTVLLGIEPSGLDRALTLACLDEDLLELPGGTATPVGPKGVRLSGGQIQRTAAARAFVRRPELLVIDDLSSALDVATELSVWSGLLDADPDRTVLAISHRPAVLDRADRIIDLGHRSA